MTPIVIGTNGLLTQTNLDKLNSPIQLNQPRNFAHNLKTQYLDQIVQTLRPYTSRHMNQTGKRKKNNHPRIKR